MTDNRTLDVVVYGATGFVGRLTAEYLARNAPAGTRIGLAGRSKPKLEETRSRIGGAAADWPLLVADAADDESLAELAGETRVVATTVGPYTRYGLPLVAACAAAGTHYADLTGEVLFMREAIQRYDAVARESGARIVHSCGFDSIPSDLGVAVLAEKVRADGAGELEQTTFAVTGMRGGVSGGTFASMKAQLEQMRDAELARAVADPYALSPDRDAEPKLGDESDLRGIVHDRDLGMWLAPFVMAGVNTRVVRRSNALQDWAYGRGLRYREVMGFRGGAAGLGKAVAVTGGLAGLMGALMTAPTRAVLDRVMPSPGEGPSERARSSGFFRIEIHTRTSKGAHYVCDVAASGDPGYAATAVMFGEAALALALDGDKLPHRAGVLTPSTGIGTTLVERLRTRGFTFEAHRA